VTAQGERQEQVYKVAVADVGSNSVRILTIGADGKLYDDLFYLRAGVQEYFVLLEDVMLPYEKAEKKVMVATEYWRKHKGEFIELKDFAEAGGWEIELLTPEREGILAWKGVEFLDGASFECLVDIGGGSFEVIKRGGEVYSWGFGAVVLKNRADEILGSTDAQGSKRVETLERILADELTGFKLGVKRVVGIGGAVVAVAMASKGVKKVEDINGKLLKFDEVEAFIDVVSGMTLDKRKELFGEGRGDIVLEGAVILKKLMECLEVEKIKTSIAGIVHGVMSEVLNEHYPDIKKFLSKV